MNQDSAKDRRRPRNHQLWMFVVLAFTLTFSTASCDFLIEQEPSRMTERSQPRRQDGQVFFEDERRDALNAIISHRLSQDLELQLSFPEGIRLKKVLDNLEAMGIARPEPGWFVLKVGDRTVVGWKGSLVQAEHIPQWEVKGNIKLAINDTALTYTPELVEGADDAAERVAKDNDIWVKFSAIMENEVQPQYAAKLAAAGSDEQRIREANDWFDQQGEEASGRVAEELGITPDDVALSLANHASRKTGSLGKQLQAATKILSAAEIDRLLMAQGAVNPT